LIREAALAVTVIGAKRARPFPTPPIAEEVVVAVAVAAAPPAPAPCGASSSDVAVVADAAYDEEDGAGLVLNDFRFDRSNSRSGLPTSFFPNIIRLSKNERKREGCFSENNRPNAFAVLDFLRLSSFVTQPFPAALIQKKNCVLFI